MAPPDLRADCAACQSLCCVALAIDAGPGFGFDKPAGEACRHLMTNGCRIHPDLVRLGQAGCAGYDCFGAGQRACRMFPGRTWREGTDVARVMFEAFFLLRDLHELRVLLHQAARLPLSAEHAQQVQAFLQPLERELDASSLRDLPLASLGTEIRAWLPTLRLYSTHVEDRPR